MTRSGSRRQRGLPLFLKRTFDVCVALVVLLLASPLMLGSALAVALTMGRPVLFRQPRPGKGGTIFHVFKLRTMSDERDSAGALLPAPQRITKLGQFLRKSSLDELPQLFNVLRGEMSLVGPRPLLVQYLERYSPRQARRHEVLPGITGLAQVSGRNAISWQQKFELDVEYVERWSLWLDLKILARTALKVLKSDGINPTDQQHTPEFLGDGVEQP